MRRSFFNRFITDQRGAIGPLYAVGILAFVAISAVGFDAGRLWALDTELQNAADQAALAAATQLDGGDDAITRARDAANNTFANASSSFTNQTRFANDGAGRPITDLGFKFYAGYTADAPTGTELSDGDGAAAEVVEVTVNARRVFYALTPLVGAFSDNAIGRAMAGLQSATCNVAPLMFCVPNNGAGVADRTFPTDADIGKGLKLHMNANQADPWAPGNFGFLDISFDIHGNPNRRLGQNNSANGCIGDVVESDTGVRDPEASALNTRMDIYPNGNSFNCVPGTGDFCPSENVRRDYVRVEVRNNRPAASVAGLTCNPNDNSTDWRLISSLSAIPSGSLGFLPPPQGLPMDNCFGNGGCTVIGDANWSGDAYMTKHHPGVSLATAAPNGTRYEVYQWELEDKSNRLATKKVGYKATPRNGPPGRYNVDLYCSYPQPKIGTGIPASPTQKDRRLLTVAAVDCTGLNGSHPVDILRWVDLFLVQPADTNGSQKAFSTEIVGPARKPNGDSGFQYFGRKKAVLIR